MEKNYFFKITEDWFILNKSKKILFGFIFLIILSTNSYSQSVGIVGDAVGTWDNDVVLSTSDNITYTLSNYTFSGGSAKFRQGGNWTVNWGTNAFPSGTGTQGGANIPVVAGTYNVTFNRTTGSYTFTAVSSTVPTLAATTAATSITTTTATSGGNVTSDGGATVTERGIVYATTANPTTGNTKVQSGSGTGSFTSNMTGLSPNTTYYVRAYAINSSGTAYGAQISFTTSASASSSVFYADRIYFKNGTASSEKYYAEYNAVPNGGCTGNNSETAGTEAWNGRNLGTYTTGTTAQLGAFIVTKGIQNGNGPIFRYRVYETGSTPPVFMQSNLNYVGECNADGVQVNGSDLDKIWRLPLSNISNKIIVKGKILDANTSQPIENCTRGSESV